MMAKEYIEREAIAKKAINMHGFCGAKYVPLSAIMKHPAADVVYVVRPDEAVLAEFENDYKDFKKIKTHLAQIIVEGKVEEPYYSILWWDEESKEYNIGYSSYCLDYVRKWLELVFEVVDTADVVEVVRCKDCMYQREAKVNANGFLICPASGMEITDMDFCSYGERRDNDGNKENL